jgi:hypothetical protein
MNTNRRAMMAINELNAKLLLIKNHIIYIDSYGYEDNCLEDLVELIDKVDDIYNQLENVSTIIYNRYENK